MTSHVCCSHENWPKNLPKFDLIANKGDVGIERFPVVVEGFGSSRLCWKPSRKVETKLKVKCFFDSIDLADLTVAVANADVDPLACQLY